MNPGPRAHRAGLATILALAAIAAIGSMAIHMLVPALPLMARELAVTPAEAQLAISFYLVALGAGQLLAGPMADRIGRRPVLLAGLAVYILGSLGTALASGLAALLAARVLQALGGACGVVTARVMVGDLFGREESASRQATLMTVVLASPALAPVIGGVLAAGVGWRAVPAVLALAALAAFALAWWTLPESRPARPAGSSGGGGSLLGDLARLARNRRFVLATAALGAGSSALYMFLASAPFLLIGQFGLSESEAGPCFLAVAAASIAGTRLVGPLARRTDALRAGCGLILAGSVIALGLAGAGLVGPLELIAPMLLLGLGAGITAPAAITAVVFAEEGLAATAASIAGATQMLASGAATVALGLFGPPSPLRLAVALVLAAALGWGAAVWRQR